MVLKLILLQFCAHLLSDFVFQPQKWSDKKSNKVFTKYHLYHILLVGTFSWIFSFMLDFWIAALIIMIIHLITDVLKSWLSLKFKSHSFFFLDQLIHLITFTIVSVLYSKIYSIQFPFQIDTYSIGVITGFILCAKPANVIMKHIFINFSIEIPENNLPDKNNTNGEKSLPNAGRLIGISERFLVLALGIMGQFQAIGLLVAAKSILRFNSVSKSEYVLVGTFVSFMIAIFSGILINFLR